MIGGPTKTKALVGQLAAQDRPKLKVCTRW
jgi:hypothetical protein